jgi:hypothetical protein
MSISANVSASGQRKICVWDAFGDYSCAAASFGAGAAIGGGSGGAHGGFTASLVEGFYGADGTLATQEGKPGKQPYPMPTPPPMQAQQIQMQMPTPPQAKEGFCGCSAQIV